MGRKRARTRELFYLCIASLIFHSFLGCATLENTRLKIKGKVEAYQSLHRSKGLFAQGDYEGAFNENLKILSLAIHRPPEDEALFNMGRISAHPENPKKNYENSTFFFKKLLEDYPQSPWSEQARIWVGMLQENENLKRAVETFHKMDEKSKQVDKKIAEHKEISESLIHSQELLAQGNFEGALRENQRVLSLSDQPSGGGDEALFNMGLIYLHPENPKRDYGKSLAFFKKLIKDYPQSPWMEQAKTWAGMLLENDKLNQKVQKLYHMIEESKQVDIEIEERKREKAK